MLGVEDEAVGVPRLEVELVQLDADLVQNLRVKLPHGDLGGVVRVVEN